MNPSRDPNDARWSELAARARADQPPPLDVAAALRAARTEAASLAACPQQSPSWATDFAALFATNRRLAGCGACAALAVVAVGLYSINLWTQLAPWVDLVWAAVEDAV